MHERRSFLIALSTTLIGVGFGALLAYYIAMAALPPNKRGGYGLVPVAAGIGMAFGVAAGVGFFVSEHSDKVKSRKVQEFTGRGIALGRRLESGDWSTVQTDLRTLVTDVEIWVREELPQHEHHVRTPGEEALYEVPAQAVNTRHIDAAIRGMLDRLNQMAMKL